MEKMFEPVDLNEVVREVLDNLEFQIKNSGVHLEVMPLPTLVASRVWMVQLFQNLLSNAIKFGKSSTPLVRISAEKKGNEWFFSFKDNGIGINSEHSDRIFGVFQRLHTRDRYPGTGLGLAIVKKIVERHGGRIWFDSNPGEGSTFHVVIPASLPHSGEKSQPSAVPAFEKVRKWN